MENQNGLATVSPEIISSLVLDGDISKMNQVQKVEYYNRFCQSLGLNPLTQPFQIIKFQGKRETLCHEGLYRVLRKIYGVSISELTSQELRGIFIVTAKAINKEGKTDAATGAVSVAGLSGDGLANALMKAETKAKRRVTLSICGLGILDESETETIPALKVQTITGEIKLPTVQLSPPQEERQQETKQETKPNPPPAQDKKPEPANWLNKHTSKKMDTLTVEWKNTTEKLRSVQ